MVNFPTRLQNNSISAIDNMSPIVAGFLSTHNDKEEAFDWASPFIITTIWILELATTWSADFFSQNHNCCPSHGLSYSYSPPLCHQPLLLLIQARQPHPL
jgi:hypothetical protein